MLWEAAKGALMNTDRWSALINVFGWIFFLVAAPSLLYQTMTSSGGIWVSWAIIYATVLLAFWPIQTVYHLMVDKKIEAELLRRVDRGSMLFLMAAIFSPCVARFATEPLATATIILLWLGAIGGMIALITIKNLSRKLAPIVGFSLGLIGIIVLAINAANISQAGLVELIVGAVFFLAGGLVYVMKKPDPSPQVFGFHEVFHSLLSIGIVFLHFLVMQALI
ncbi:MAG: hemolysin III family protein [Smithellaceae bacterium]|nr:hemolysin III family protein [Smithellaceae bacterium]